MSGSVGNVQGPGRRPGRRGALGVLAAVGMTVTVGCGGGGVITPVGASRTTTPSASDVAPPAVSSVPVSSVAVDPGSQAGSTIPVTPAASAVPAVPAESAVPAPPPAPPAGPSCDPAVIAADLGVGGVEVIDGLCLGPWAYVDSCVGAECGDSQRVIVHDGTRWVTYTAFPTPICRGEILGAGAPIAIVDRIVWPCEGGAPSAAPADPDLLKLGSRGDDVRRLQEELRIRGYSVGVDGEFGPGTEQAVILEQQDMGMDDDGYVGPQTRAGLGIGSDIGSTYRSTTEFMDALVARLNGDSSIGVPADALLSIGTSDIPGVDWSWSGSVAAAGNRSLSNVVFGGDGGVYLYGTVCTVPAADGTISWCGLWDLMAH